MRLILEVLRYLQERCRPIFKGILSTLEETADPYTCGHLLLHWSLPLKYNQSAPSSGPPLDGQPGSLWRLPGDLPRWEYTRLRKSYKRPVGLYSSAAYWNHDDQGKGSSSELDMSEYIMFGLDWVCLTTTRPSGHISRRINNVWPMLRQWSFLWSFQDVCLAVLYVRKG